MTSVHRVPRTNAAQLSIRQRIASRALADRAQRAWPPTYTNPCTVWLEMTDSGHPGEFEEQNRPFAESYAASRA